MSSRACVGLPELRFERNCAQEKRPSYRELEELLRATEGSSAGKTWVQRIQSEFAFNRDSLDRKQ